MKKFFAIGIALLSVSLVLAACGDGGTEYLTETVYEEGDTVYVDKDVLIQIDRYASNEAELKSALAVELPEDGKLVVGVQGGITLSAALEIPAKKTVYILNGGALATAKDANLSVKSAVYVGVGGTLNASVGEVKVGGDGVIKVVASKDKKTPSGSLVVGTLLSVNDGQEGAAKKTVIDNPDYPGKVELDGASFTTGVAADASIDAVKAIFDASKAAEVTISTALAFKPSALIAGLTHEEDRKLHVRSGTNESELTISVPKGLFVVTTGALTYATEIAVIEGGGLTVLKTDAFPAAGVKLTAGGDFYTTSKIEFAVGSAVGAGGVVSLLSPNVTFSGAGTAAATLNVVAGSSLFFNNAYINFPAATVISAIGTAGIKINPITVPEGKELFVGGVTPLVISEDSSTPAAGVLALTLQKNAKIVGKVQAGGVTFNGNPLGGFAVPLTASGDTTITIVPAVGAVPKSTKITGALIAGAGDEITVDNTYNLTVAKDSKFTVEGNLVLTGSATATVTGELAFTDSGALTGSGTINTSPAVTTGTALAPAGVVTVNSAPVLEAVLAKAPTAAPGVLNVNQMANINLVQAVSTDTASVSVNGFTTLTIAQGNTLTLRKELALAAGANLQVQGVVYIAPAVITAGSLATGSLVLNAGATSGAVGAKINTGNTLAYIKYDVNRVTYSLNGLQGIIQFGENSAIAGEWEAVWGTAASTITFSTKPDKGGGEIKLSAAGAKLTGRHADSVIIALGDKIEVTGEIDITATAATTTTAASGGTVALIGDGKPDRGSAVLVLKGSSASNPGKLTVGSGSTPITPGAVSTALTDANSSATTAAAVTQGGTSPSAVLTAAMVNGTGTVLGNVTGIGAGVDAVITGPAGALVTSDITSGWKVKVTL